MTELAVRENSLMPAMTIQEAVDRYNTVVDFTKQVMKEDKDFGVIPGTGTKPTLLKPGAEKLCTLFGLSPQFELMDSITDFDKGLFYFQYRCVLLRHGEPVASGIGSCNSKEKKYAYRWVPEFKASEAEKELATERDKRTSKNGNQYFMLKVPNSEPFDLVNTIDKMAQKRALVAATLIGTNASEFFTQDIEDMSFIEGNFTVEDEPESEQKDNEQNVKQEQKKYDFKSRPYDAETLKAALEKKAEKIGERTASKEQRNYLGSMLSQHFMDDKIKRYTASRWLFGEASTKKIDGAMVQAAMDWLAITEDSGGAPVIDKNAAAELDRALTAALKAEGQEELL